MTQCPTCGFGWNAPDLCKCAERAALVESRRPEMRAWLDRKCDCLTCEVMPRATGATGAPFDEDPVQGETMKGYHRHEHKLPPLPPPPWPPATAEGQAMEAKHFAALELAVQFEAKAKPWTLVRLPGESWLWIANWRSPMMRRRTAELNVERAEENARHMAYLASRSRAKYAADTACDVTPQ